MIVNRGLRHLALRVRDVSRAVEFYTRVFGMRLVWQPDEDNAYLSSGCDNLALHRTSRPEGGDADAGPLDHLGFIVPALADLETGWRWAQAEHLDIVHPLTRHRDDSVSFYIRDPDGNVIQLLFEPGISPLEINSRKA